MVRNNFYKLGIYAERQVPYLPKFKHKCLPAREQRSLVCLCVCVCISFGIYTPLTRKYTYYESVSSSPDRQTDKPTTEWTLLLLLLPIVGACCSIWLSWGIPRQLVVYYCPAMSQRVHVCSALWATVTWLRAFVMFSFCCCCCCHWPISFA